MRRNILYITLWGICCIAMFACSSPLDEEPPVFSGTSGKVNVEFTLAMNKTQSRAISFENPENDENAIDLKTLKFFLYTFDYQYLDEIKNVIPYSYEGNTYHLLGELPKAYSDFRIVVLCNCNTSQQSLSSFIPFNSENLSYIPMWGVSTYSGFLKPDTVNDLGTIDLLRAMAKVEVTLDDNLTENFILTGVSFNKYNKMGYCLPKEYDKTNQTKDLSPENDWFNVNNDVEGNNLQFMPYGGDKGNHFVAYIPEYDNSDGTLQMPVSITTTEGISIANSGNSMIEFKNYADGSPFNVVRNHVYHFNITKIGPAEQDITLEVTVERYAEIALSPSYGD